MMSPEAYVREHLLAEPNGQALALGTTVVS